MFIKVSLKTFFFKFSEWRTYAHWFSWFHFIWLSILLHQKMIFVTFPTKVSSQLFLFNCFWPKHNCRKRLQNFLLLTSSDKQLPTLICSYNYTLSLTNNRIVLIKFFIKYNQRATLIMPPSVYYYCCDITKQNKSEYILSYRLITATIFWNYNLINILRGKTSSDSMCCIFWNVLYLRG